MSRVQKDGKDFYEKNRRKAEIECEKLRNMKRIDTTGYREEEGTRDESRIA